MNYTNDYNNYSGTSQLWITHHPWKAYGLGAGIESLIVVTFSRNPLNAYM